MHTLSLNAYAKINLVLDVLKRRPDGYHEIHSVMQTISLYDEIVIQKRKKGIHLTCEGTSLPEGMQNIACRAAKILLEQKGKPKGIAIHIKKNIPVAAGLGGGSSDAAAVLLGVNYLYNFGCSVAELVHLGSQLGSDVPFCVVGGTCQVRGRGEKINILPPVSTLWLVLVKPPFDVITGEVYAAWDSTGNEVHPDVDKVISAVYSGKKDELVRFMGNSLEKATNKLYPATLEIRDKLRKAGAMQVMLCGSGPTYMGVAEDKDHALSIAQHFKNTFYEVHVVNTR